MKSKKDSQQRIQAIASVLELFRKADALSVDDGVLLHDWVVIPDHQIDLEYPDAALVETSYDNGDGEITDEISLAEIEKFAEVRNTKPNDVINKIHYKDQNGDDAYVRLFYLLPVRAFNQQSDLAKQFAVEAVFCDLNLDDLASLYDELVAASGSNKTLGEVIDKYELTPWHSFQELSSSSMIEEMTNFAHSFDAGVERPRKFY